MEIVEIIKPKENVKEFIEEKLKKAIKEVTPYKKPLVQSPKITRFFSQHTISSLGNIVRRSCLLVVETWECINQLFGHAKQHTHNAAK